MDCKGTSFVTCRDAWDEWLEYGNLKISREQEREWREELIAEQSAKLDKYRNWLDYAWLEGICEQEHSKENLMTVVNAIPKIDYECDRPDLSENDKYFAEASPICYRLAVVESIIGRLQKKGRGGLIAWAYKFGDYELIQKLYDMALELIDEAEALSVDDEENTKRAKHDRAELQTVMDDVAEGEPFSIP